jgi:hypothetical protein
MFWFRRRQPLKCLVIIHIPKTAGTTLRRIVEAQVPAKRIFPIYKNNEGFRRPEDLKRLPPWQKKRIEVLMGHFGMECMADFPQPFECFTMLRDPVQKVLSGYTHAMHLHKRWKDNPVPFAEFLRTSGKLSLNNHQCRLLSGIVPPPKPGECQEGMLDLARENIARHFCLVGLSEYFDESVFLLSRHRGWSPPYYVRENVSKNRLQREELDAESLEMINEFNRLDITLYQEVKANFLSFWQARDAQFHAEFAEFKEKNRQYALKHQPKIVWQ